MNSGGGWVMSTSSVFQRPSAPWLRVSPASGRLDGDQQARLAVSATRDGLP